MTEMTIWLVMLLSTIPNFYTIIMFTVFAIFSIKEKDKESAVWNFLGVAGFLTILIAQIITLFIIL